MKYLKSRPHACLSCSLLLVSLVVLIGILELCQVHAFDKETAPRMQNVYTGGCLRILACTLPSLKLDLVCGGLLEDLVRILGSLGVMVSTI